MANSDESGRILALWSAPRCRSTALFRMMSERGDFTPVHEPFSYLAGFGTADVAGTQTRSEQELLAALRILAEQQPVFFKDTTDERYPGVLADTSFLAGDARYVFLHPPPARDNRLLLRDQSRGAARPDRVRGAARAVHRGPRADRRGATGHRRRGPGHRPEAVIQAYCAHVGIDFRAESLAWRPGARSEWQPSEQWHRDAGASTGFEQKPRTGYTDVDSRPVLGQSLEYHLPYYDKLRVHRVKL